MMVSTRLLRLARRLVLLAMLLPFAAVSLLAQGVMPQAASAGQVVLVLCTGDGPVEMVLDASGTPVLTGRDSGDHAKDPRCAWAQAQVSVALPVITAVPLPPQSVEQIQPSARLTVWHPAHDPRGPWPRGPPPSV